MAEEEAPKPVEPEASQTASPRPETATETPAATEIADVAKLEATAPEAAKPTLPAAPPNKLHEWGAAVGIMIFLALVLYVFLNFLRGVSL